MNSKKAELLMVSVSFVWGSSYLLMKIGLGSIAPFNLIALRFGIAFLFMTLIFLPKYRLAKRSDMVKGILMGILLFLTFSGMVYGVNRTTASAAGFLASTTVIFIPIFGEPYPEEAPSQTGIVQHCPGRIRAVSSSEYDPVWSHCRMCCHLYDVI